MSVTSAKKAIMLRLGESGELGCTCQGCGDRYFLDVSVSDALWETIKPKGKPQGAGLLCPQCIADRLTSLCANLQEGAGEDSRL